MPDTTPTTPATGWTGLDSDLADRLTRAEDELSEAIGDRDAAQATTRRLDAELRDAIARANRAEHDRDQARAERDTLRQALHAAETLLSEARSNARRASVERDQARAELADIRRQLARIVTSAGSHYEQIIRAARCASSPDDSADYWRWCGQAQALRETINEIARVAGITPPDWGQIRASVPADGVYRAAPVPASRAQGAATPAVDPAAGRTTPPEGDRTRGDDHGPQGGAQPVRTWHHADHDGDTATLTHIPESGGCVILSTTDQDGAVAVRLDPAAAASLHTWLGQHLGTAPSTPDRPEPGPQDIPEAWMLVHLRRVNIEAALDIADDELLDHPDTDPYRQAIRSAYRVGYAAAVGCEITVADEGDYIHIGDRWPDSPTEAIECPSLADIRQHHTP